MSKIGAVPVPVPVDVGVNGSLIDVTLVVNLILQIAREHSNQCTFMSALPI